jgi:small subunit ribosomal protein S8
MSFITDPIGDMLIRIKNANQRKTRIVSIPHSNIKESMLNILKEQGYINNFSIKKEGIKKNILVELKYKGPQKAITGVKRISKPGLRVYLTSQELPSVFSGFGIAIISTSNGIMTSKNAKKQGMGGEVLAYV